MAAGKPDYCRVVDIAYQALSEMIVRPKYGGAYFEGQQKVVTPSDYTDLITVSGKGMVYGGVVWLDYTYTQANDEVVVMTDGANLNDLSFLRLQEYSVKQAGSYPVTINKYDPVNYVYSVGISYGVTFETELKVKYRETYGRDPTVWSRLVYAMI